MKKEPKIAQVDGHLLLFSPAPTHLVQPLRSDPESRYCHRLRDRDRDDARALVYERA